MLTRYFSSAPTPASTLAFAAIMGFLWLGVAPLVSGWIAETFGLRWQAMLGGVAFFSHQIGSFVGAFGGGTVYDALGSYTMARRAGVVMGLSAGPPRSPSRSPPGPARHAWSPPEPTRNAPIQLPALRTGAGGQIMAGARPTPARCPPPPPSVPCRHTKAFPIPSAPGPS